MPVSTMTQARSGTRASRQPMEVGSFWFVPTTAGSYDILKVGALGQVTPIGDDVQSWRAANKALLQQCYPTFLRGSAAGSQPAAATNGATAAPDVTRPRQRRIRKVTTSRSQ